MTSRRGLSHRLLVSLTPEDADAVLTLAAERRVSAAEIMRLCLQGHLPALQKRTHADLSRRAEAQARLEARAASFGRANA